MEAPVFITEQSDRVMEEEETSNYDWNENQSQQPK